MYHLSGKINRKMPYKSSVLCKLYECFIATATELSDPLCYFDNGSTRYDGKECVESIAKL